MNKPTIHHTTEEKVIIGKAICEEYARGVNSIASCAESHGISVRTFNNWALEITEVSDAYKTAAKEARINQQSELKALAMTSLKKLVNGFEADEVRQKVIPVYDAEGNEIGVKNVEITRIKKVFAPNCMAVMYTLNAVESETFKYHTPIADQEEQVFLVGGKPIKF